MNRRVPGFGRRNRSGAGPRAAALSDKLSDTFAHFLHRAVDFSMELTNATGGPGTWRAELFDRMGIREPKLMQPFVPVMAPPAGERFSRFVGDRLEFRLQDVEGRPAPQGWRALLRTNLGRAAELRREILEAHTRGLPPAGGSWRDVPMVVDERGWRVELPLAEVGYFKAKAYAVDPRGWQHWPEGPDVGISVHPNKYRTANILYCAFTRLFGSNSPGKPEPGRRWAEAIQELDQAQYTVIPPSGKLRELAQQLPEIVERLGCRILHLLPVHPTPSTYARFGRFGSPYAALDLTGIDPALVVFDRRTTGADQFRELTYAAHRLGAGVFLDIVINHTGWGSVLQERHSEWFLRNPDQTFASPGAWGVTWEDLVELKHQNVELWDKLAEIFLIWCRRGVDGFRCDAGYKVPVAAWQYIVARVQQEFPETIFLLEGLGGAWEATEALLTEGGMQWAYSELFQNYSGVAVAGYLDHCFRQSSRVGLLVHYSETHDNDRLAAKGRTWSLLRNRLSALSSVAGGFGFTCGVEWLCPEKIKVHERTALGWGNPDNLISELGRLNQVLAEHPCFFDGARLERLSPADSAVYALLRESEEGLDRVLVLANTSVENAGTAKLPGVAGLAGWVDLLGQKPPKIDPGSSGSATVHLEPGAAYCLSPAPQARGLSGGEYRQKRAQSAWALQAISVLRAAESIPRLGWRELAEAVERDPARFLAALSSLGQREFPASFLADLQRPGLLPAFPQVVTWTLLDCRRVTLVPPGHWLLVQDPARFRASLSVEGIAGSEHVESIATSAGQVAWFAPRAIGAEATLQIERYDGTDSHGCATVRFLPRAAASACWNGRHSVQTLAPTDMVLLTNARGGMARLCVDLGRINSKYDCVLAANLHPTLPVDRHVLVKRIRVWVNGDGFISPLDARNLQWFAPGPPAVWHFVANAGDGRTVELQVSAQMLPERNATVFCFARPSAAQALGKQLPETADVRLSVRLDLEDRNFHWETRRNGGAEYHFTTHLRSLPPSQGQRPDLRTVAPAEESDHFGGFAFTPSADRAVRVYVDGGLYHPQPEWSENIAHPVEQSRGQTGAGDAFSPGWFELPLGKGAAASLIITADPTDPEPETIAQIRTGFTSGRPEGASAGPEEPENRGSVQTTPGLTFEDRLLQAVKAFVVRRADGKTVIAGYPWFLDWGRDTFICARGLLAAGMKQEVQQILLTFARFERDGTLPNTIFGEDASNRDTSDAPLWFGLVCEEANLELDTLRPTAHRTLRQVLESIATNYQQGTPNGIRVDPESGLVWSPSHFTWMDTNYPACTPREGYPVEIQALWIRLLRQLTRLAGGTEAEKWERLARQAQASVDTLFWREDKGYYADVLLAGRNQAARTAVVDDALRSNCLLLVSLGLSSDERGRRCVEAARRHLLVPGALRSLAPLPVSVPLANCGNDGRLLNDPRSPYWGRYEGDEDTRRKPAYHNGTAWTWSLPVFCEALARAWGFAPEAVAAARAYLGSLERLMSEGCLGQIPEILDGDAPHSQRGCDAQAWGATETLRVCKLLR